jgi:hypothetical protein
MNTTTTENTIKVTKNKSGQIVRANKAVKVPKEALKLTCTVTGKSRPTNQKYLDAKAQKLNVSVQDIITYYVSKEGLATIIANTEYPNRDNLLKYNGKTRTKTDKAPKAEKATKASTKKETVSTDPF